MAFIGIFAIIATPLSIYYFRQIKNKKTTIADTHFAIKIVAAVLVICLIIKISINAATGFSKMFLPFSLSDFTIFVMLFYAFTKTNTNANKISHNVLIIFCSLTMMTYLIYPTSIWSTTDDKMFNFTSFHSWFGMSSHFCYIGVFIWMILWRKYQIKTNQYLFSIITWAILLLIVIVAAYSLNENYDHCYNFVSKKDVKDAKWWWTICWFLILNVYGTGIFFLLKITNKFHLGKYNLL
ncbi:MAG: hypothetical protein LBL60_00715 [Mycoplasmataceae bacterium]|nr:hypothetical protein [Mycoplasmataceae bacterium]